MPDAWSVMGDYLYLTTHLFSLEILSFVLMGNHFHLLVRAPQANISPAMNYFMRETSREVSRLSGRINQTYGGRHHKSVVHTPDLVFSQCFLKKKQVPKLKAGSPNAAMLRKKEPGTF